MKQAAIKNKIQTNYDIPSDWTVMPLGTLGSFSKGKGILKEQVISDGLPCIRYGEIYTTHDFIIKEFKSFISDDVAAESKEIENGDILFAGSGETIEEIGKAVAYIGSEKAYAGGDVIILSTKKDVNPECLSYALETDFVKRQKRVLGQGNSVVHIYPSDLSKVKIILPPLPEQKNIAQVLSTADAAIHTNEKLIAQKELRKKWLMQQLLTGKKRLKGFGEEWKENKLEYFIKEYKQKPTGVDNYEVLTSAKSGLMKQTDYYGDNRITNRDDADYNVIPPNYLTYRSRSDDGLFTFNKNDLGITGLISGYYPVFTIKNGDLDFILMYMNYYKQKLTKYAIGTSQLVLAMNSLKEAKFVLPEHEEQAAIARVLQSADKEISLLKLTAEKLREKKKGLMQKLLTGKIRIK
ncbi:MAG: restriction endonuclease subunit S [Bacteroidota bacterium]|nr:restriction endonuclease subunit S [Bacteroidota bacterium]